MTDLGAAHVPEIDAIRVDLPGQGHRVSVLLTPDNAARLMAALRVALAYREPAAPKRPRTRKTNP